MGEKLGDNITAMAIFEVLSEAIYFSVDFRELLRENPLAWNAALSLAILAQREILPLTERIECGKMEPLTEVVS